MLDGADDIGADGDMGRAAELSLKDEAVGFLVEVLGANVRGLLVAESAFAAEGEEEAEPQWRSVEDFRVVVVRAGFGSGDWAEHAGDGVSVARAVDAVDELEKALEGLARLVARGSFVVLLPVVHELRDERLC